MMMGTSLGNTILVSVSMKDRKRSSKSNLVQFLSSKTSVLFSQSFKHFAQSTAVGLSCYVQIVQTIGRLNNKLCTKRYLAIFGFKMISGLNIYRNRYENPSLNVSSRYHLSRFTHVVKSILEILIKSLHEYDKEMVQSITSGYYQMVPMCLVIETSGKTQLHFIVCKMINFWGLPTCIPAFLIMSGPYLFNMLVLFCNVLLM